MEECQRCYHIWKPRKTNVKICPKCKSKLFREEKIKALFSRNNSEVEGKGWAWKGPYKNTKKKVLRFGKVPKTKKFYSGYDPKKKEFLEDDKRPYFYER